jgi:hypothetical protein
MWDAHWFYKLHSANFHLILLYGFQMNLWFLKKLSAGVRQLTSHSSGDCGNPVSDNKRLPIPILLKLNLMKRKCKHGFSSS